MASSSVIHLTTKEAVDNLLNTTDYFFMDCDGVCYLDNSAIEGSAAVIEALRAKGKKVIYATNNGRVTRKQIVDKLRALGFKADENEVMCSTYVAAVYLKKKKFEGKVYLMAESGMEEELVKAGIRTAGFGPDTEFDLEKITLDPEVNAVILSLDFEMNMAKLIKLCSYVRSIDPSSGLYMATNPDKAMPLARKDIMVPDTGCTVAYVEFATGKKPTFIGKPTPLFYEGIKNAMDIVDIDPKKVAMFGDQYRVDILFAKNNGFGAAILVGTGVDKIADADQYSDSAPSHYLPKLSDMLPFLK
ncbi:Glycerol-3-phosphate phosphatase [Halotydeus destructor]|nr:Glycerol-3-phosphate phosphatase [Halotydeus destructor]